MTALRNRVQIGFHHGGTLMKLAGFYATMLSVIGELIQNALDAGASQIEVKVNQRTRFASVRDNGQGFGEEKFHKEISKSIGQSIKGSGSLGKFGIGFISPLGKCVECRVTSCEDPETDSYNEWTLNTEAIRVQHETLHIPQKSCAGRYLFDPSRPGAMSGKCVWWRTEVAIHEYTKNKQLSELDLDSMSGFLSTSYSTAMRKHGTTIKIFFVDHKGKELRKTLTASNFDGTPLREERYNIEDTGNVLIKMFKVKRRKGKKAGGVNINFGNLGEDFRFSWKDFAVSQGGRLLDKDVRDALASGFFEGEILAEKVALHPNRTCFESDDALVGLCICINGWFSEHGKKYFDDERQSRQDERFRKLGGQALGRIGGLLNDPRNKGLRSRLRDLFGSGNGGGITVPPPEDDVIDNVTPPEPGPKDKPVDPKPKPNNDKPKPRKEPKVRGVHLSLDYDDMEGYPDLWRFDKGDLTIVFNIRHPDWVECEGTDLKLQTLMEIVSLQVICLELEIGSDFHEVIKQHVDIVTGLISIWISGGGGRSTGN